MAFRLKKKESVSKAVRRLGRERMDDALQCLAHRERAQTVHRVRKDIKRVRAVVQLVRSEIPKKACGRITGLLREAADQLSPIRDAYVKAMMLKKLKQHFPGLLAPGAFRHTLTELRDVFDEEMKRFAKKRIARKVARSLRGVEKELNQLKVSGKGWKALCPGVKASYSKGQRAYQTVLKDSSPENFHEWRKSAKTLWYQVTLLQRIWPEQMDAMADELDKLGDLLGDDHDCVMLREATDEKGAVDAKQAELEMLKGLIDERQSELRTAALAIGSRFYSEKPSVFCNRLAGYWQIWRNERSPGIKSAEATS